MGGESSPWGVAFGRPGRKPSVLTVPEGGTGDSTLTSGGFVIGAGTSALTATKSPTGMTSINGNAIPTNAGGTFLTTAGAVSATTGLTLTPMVSLAAAYIFSYVSSPFVFSALVSSW